MSWTELDFQTGKAKRPEARKLSDEQLQENERMRLCLRDRAKWQIAEAELTEKRVAEIQESLDVIDAKKESLAFDHQRRIAPWKDELAQAEAKQLQAIRAKQPSDPLLDARRAELLSLIREATSELEKAIAAEDHIYSPLAQEKYESRLSAVRLRTEGEADLRQHPRPDLKLREAVASHEFTRASHYAMSCRENLNTHKTEFWEACLANAERDLEEKRQASADAFQAIMSE